MSNYINNLQYDTSTSYNTGVSYYFSVGLLASSSGPAEDEIFKSTRAVDYQLSNNGSFYAGANYIVYQADGFTVTVLSDNAAHNDWWNSWTTVSNSSHAATGGAQNDSESTIYGKDGNIYVTDSDPSGNNVASAVFSQSNGAMISSKNWASGPVDNNFANGPDKSGMPGPGYGAVFSSYNETEFGNPGAGPNPNPSVKAGPSSNTVDLSKVSSAELKTDFTSAANLSQHISRGAANSSSIDASTRDLDMSASHGAGLALLQHHFTLTHPAVSVHTAHAAV